MDLIKGRLIKFTDLQNNSKNDWKKEYVNKRGLITVMNSHNKAWILFLTFDDKYLQTSVGDIKINENLLTITTKNSIYIFKIEKEVIK